MSLYRIGDWGSRALWSQNAETPSSKTSNKVLTRWSRPRPQGGRRGDNSTDRVCRAGPLSLNFTLDLRQKHVPLGDLLSNLSTLLQPRYDHNNQNVNPADRRAKQVSQGYRSQFRESLTGNLRLMWSGDGGRPIRGRPRTLLSTTGYLSLRGGSEKLEKTSI